MKLYGPCVWLYVFSFNLSIRSFSSIIKFDFDWGQSYELKKSSMIIISLRSYPIYIYNQITFNGKNGLCIWERLCTLMTSVWVVSSFVLTLTL